MADLLRCELTDPHSFHGWGEGPPWHVCLGVEFPTPTSPDCRAGAWDEALDNLPTPSATPFPTRRNPE